MFSLRQKIFIGHLLVFLIFLSLMFPFASRTVKKIVVKSMEDRASELISKVQTAPNDDALIRLLKESKARIFFRFSVINNEKKVLYDSHTKRVLGPRFSQDYVVDHPEVLDAFQNDKGYNEDYSELLSQKFAYVAKAFDFHGKKYVLRTAFPINFVIELTHNFEMGFLGLASAVLFMFSIMTWFIINHLTSPIHQIINAVKPYQNGEVHTIPEIQLGNTNPNDDFSRLALVLNSLSAKIQGHINNLTVERNEKEAVLESLVEGVVAIDNKLNVTYANNMALNLLGIKRDQLIGKHISISNHQMFHEMLEKCLQENIVITDTTEMKQGRNKIYVDIVAAPTKDKSGAILVLQDKSPHYKILEMRKDFIANASHELKTPITIIRGFAETLHENPNLPQEIAKEITEKIVNNCLRMGNLVKDLLTLTDIEKIPESRLIEFELVDLIRGCSEMINDAHPDAVITIDSKPEVEMLGDPILLEMAFTNLIENAAKYSDAPAEIDIKITDDDQTVRITISDKGIGIPKSDLEHIFQRFYTVDKAHSKKMGGSGLGLSIVQTIIEKHHGDISVDSEITEGTVFTIHLPKQAG